MDFVETAKTSEILPGSMKDVAINNQNILISNINGKYYAIGEKCTHAKGSLSKGKLEGKIITCPRHGSKFDVTTGNVVGGPAKQNEPTYEVKVEGNIIKVIYFSGLRVVEYNGKVDEKLALLIRAEGFPVDLLEVDEFQDSIRIVQARAK